MPGPAQAQAKKPKLATRPALVPAFSWEKRDYVVRCSRRKGGATATVRVPRGWRARIGRSGFRARTFRTRLNRGAGRGTYLVVKRPGTGVARRFHVRCLPRDFPRFRFERYRQGGPRLTFAQVENSYVVIFDRHGAPVWWLKNRVSPLNPQLLRDGTLSWLSLVSRPEVRVSYGIHDLRGRLVRHVVPADGLLTEAHELRLLPNGNYLIGGFRWERNLDTAPFGGGSEATALGLQLQEVRRNGSLAWTWNSGDHIALAETGRWWRNLANRPDPYDTVHFNSADVRPGSVLLSFRHLDAVYEIDRSSGEIEWKLGGTGTAESLATVDDPLGGYPLGGPHDARYLPDGSISIFDNGTNLERPPRVLRYRIDEQDRTATLVSAFGDPRVRLSGCCGSSRLLPGGGWLVNWGGIGAVGEYGNHGLIGAYTSSGRPVFRLRVTGTHPYRVQPITGKYPSLNQLRVGMNAIQGRG